MHSFGDNTFRKTESPQQTNGVSGSSRPRSQLVVKEALYIRIFLEMEQLIAVSQHALQFDVMCRNQHLRVPAYRLKYRPRCGEALDCIRAAEQFINHKHGAGALLRTFDERVNCLYLSEVVALPGFDRLLTTDGSHHYRRWNIGFRAKQKPTVRPRITLMPTILMNVVFPAMLEPVISADRSSSRMEFFTGLSING